jgi:hypothetical protein
LVFRRGLGGGEGEVEVDEWRRVVRERMMVKLLNIIKEISWGEG